MPQKRRGRKKTDPKATKSEPLTVVPDPPKDLGPYGQNYWRTLAPLLIELRILTPLHIDSFRVLCELWQEYRELTVFLASDWERRFFETDKGYRLESPELRQRDKTLAAMCKMWLKFGLTPHALVQLGKHGGLSASQISKIAEFAKSKYVDED